MKFSDLRPTATAEPGERQGGRDAGEDDEKLPDHHLPPFSVDHPPSVGGGGHGSLAAD
jgi:hypothetical protein